jgi:hypothetical protein
MSPHQRTLQNVLPFHLLRILCKVLFQQNSARFDRCCALVAMEDRLSSVLQKWSATQPLVVKNAEDDELSNDDFRPMHSSTHKTVCSITSHKRRLPGLIVAC